MPAKKRAPLFVPQTSLLDVQDALCAIRASVDVAIAALERDDEPTTALMLQHAVSRPLEAQAGRIAKTVDYLVRPRPRAKRKARR